MSYFIDYVAKDYASFRQQMIDNIPTVIPEYTNRDSSDFGIF